MVSGDLIVGADGERSLVKAEFKDGQSLRQAPYRLFRAIVPTEKLSIDERDRTMMGITSQKFALFTTGTRTLSWFEGRDGLLQDLEAGYMIEEGDDLKAGTSAACILKSP
jgi:salicylate hydroxylase